MTAILLQIILFNQFLSSNKSVEPAAVLAVTANSLAAVACSGQGS